MKPVLRTFALLLLLPTIARAQLDTTPKPISPLPTPPPGEPAYITEPVDMAVHKLPPNFRGHSPWLIYNSLVEQVGPKGTFETTVEYQKRTAAIRAGLSTVTFVTPVELRAGESLLSYNADKGVLSITVFLSELFLGTLEEFKWRYKAPQTFSLASEDTGTGFYTGANAYGATVRVRSEHGREVRLVLTNPKGFPVRLRDVLPKIVFNVPLAPDPAATARETSGILAFWEAVPPYVAYWQDHLAPTIQSRTERTINQNFIYGKVKEFWFYSKTDGTIYARWQPKK